MAGFSDTARFPFGKALALLVLSGLQCATTAELPPSGVSVLDDFYDLTPWSVAASDDVKATLHPSDGPGGRALCLDFDFGKVSGYATVRRPLALNFPENYEFGLEIRGDAPPNNLQFKLLDASGENVWWVNRPDIDFPRDWQPLRFKKRHIEFAWGPASSHRLEHSAAIEFVIASGKGGGRGTVCFDRLILRTLPAAGAATAARGAPSVNATSTLAPSQTTFAIDGSLATAWRSDPATGPDQMLTVDLGGAREFGGVVLHWLPGEHASRYTIELSDDAQTWRVVRRVNVGNGGADPILLSESEARYLRVHMLEGPAHAYALAELEIKDPDFGATPNAFLQALAHGAPRGYYPRGFSEEQAYWTVVGIDGGMEQALFGEEGGLELGPGAPAIEPMLITEKGLLTWADVDISQTLPEGYLPLPQVRWHTDDLALRISAFAAGERTRAEVVARYTVENHTARSRSVVLVIAVRPFQVNPPQQFLTVPGGYSPIRTMAWDGNALNVNGRASLFPLRAPSQVVMAPFDAGNLPELLSSSARPAAASVEDDTGMASGALLYRLTLPPHGARTVDFVAPLTGAVRLPAANSTRIATAWVQKEERTVTAYWRRALNHASLQLPAAGRPVVDTLRSALAHILIDRAGPALRPGTRSYRRTWIRDGAMISVALLRLGREDTVREFADWFAPYQFSLGKVPCCVDSRGSDPVPENDSQGEFLFLSEELYRYTGDTAWLRALWPRLSQAAAYMESLRQQERGPRNATGLQRAYFGLMPPSISHEGYSDKPAYSYWDDFWALKGYRSITRIAHTLGYEDDAVALARQRDEFRADLLASIKATTEQHSIDFIPGSADRGDFDATSTTIALSPGGEAPDVPADQLQATFERYWREFLERRAGGQGRDLYTPYEMRVIGAFVRLGWRDRAAQLLEFFLADRRPLHWNQWSEVVRREPRKAGYIGDLPHGWVASDFIRSALDLFAYERETDHSLVLAAGVPASWMADTGVELRGLRTPYGPLSYDLRRVGERIKLTVPATLTVPPGGLVLRLPPGATASKVSVNGVSARFDNAELRIAHLPAHVVMDAQ
jgi:F5/8 type C domain